MAYGYLGNSSGMAGGLLSDAYIDPMTAGFSAAAQALLPLMGPTRTPTGGLGAALAAAGSGYSTGVTAARQQNLQMTPLLIQQIRMNGIAQRHPDWFGQQPPADPSALDTQAASSPPPGPSPLQQSQDLIKQTGASPGGLVMQQPPPDGGVSAGTGALPGQQIAAGPGAPAPLPTQAQPANAFARPGQPGGTGLPTTAQDAEDYLFLHPEMKEIVAKNFAGPSDLSRLFSEQKQFPPGSPQYNAYQLAIAKAQGIDVSPNLRPGVPLRLLNPTTGKYDIVAQNPILGPGQIPSADGTAAGLVSGYLPNAAAVAGVEQGAILNRERGLSDFNYRQKYGDLGQSPPPGPLPPPQKTSNGFSIGGPVQDTTPAAPPKPIQNTAPAAPPKAGEPIDIANPNAPMLIHTTPVKTQDGSILPPLSEQGKLPSGSAAMDAAVPSWQARTDGWANTVPLAQTAEHRLMVIADAFKKVQTGMWLTNKMEFGAALESLGIDLGAKADDIGEVQKALHENYAETMGDLKAVTQKFTQMEFKVTSENKEHPNLQPSANLQMLGDDIGKLRQLQQLPTDFTRAQTLSKQWQNPAAFETAWLRANPLSKYSADVIKEIGPLRGQPGNDGTPAAAATPAAPSFAIGQTATGRNKEKIRWNGAKWETVNGR